jgi:hypothetical protein
MGDGNVTGFLDGPDRGVERSRMRLPQVNPTEAEPEVGEGNAHLTAAGHDESRSSRLAPLVTTAVLPCLRTTEKHPGVNQLYKVTARYCA